MHFVEIRTTEMYTTNNQYNNPVCKSFDELQSGYFYSINVSLTSHKDCIIAWCKNICVMFPSLFLMCSKNCNVIYIYICKYFFQIIV